jgi:hypothetical protein
MVTPSVVAKQRSGVLAGAGGTSDAGLTIGRA